MNGFCVSLLPLLTYVDFKLNDAQNNLLSLSWKLIKDTLLFVNPGFIVHPVLCIVVHVQIVPHELYTACIKFFSDNASPGALLLIVHRVLRLVIVYEFLYAWSYTSFISPCSSIGTMNRSTPQDAC